MTNIRIPTCDELLAITERVAYDPGTGIFTWLKVPVKKPKKLGTRAGTVCKRGNRDINIGNNSYKEHRVAWYLMTGRWPSFEIDHKDLDKANNKWENLRQATRSQNVANTPIRITNTSGYKGVCWDRQSSKWKAQTRGKSIGLFNSPAEAHAAYVKAAKKFWGEFARNG